MDYFAMVSIWIIYYMIIGGMLDILHFDKYTLILWQIQFTILTNAICNSEQIYIMVWSVYDDRRAYLIFVIFFTLADFKPSKFYTKKRVKFRQKLPHDKKAWITSRAKLHSESKITHCVKLHTECKTSHWVKLRTAFKITHCV